MDRIQSTVPEPAEEHRGSAAASSRSFFAPSAVLRLEHWTAIGVPNLAIVSIGLQAVDPGFDPVGLKHLPARHCQAANGCISAPSFGEIHLVSRMHFLKRDVSQIVYQWPQHLAASVADKIRAVAGAEAEVWAVAVSPRALVILRCHTHRYSFG